MHDERLLQLIEGSQKGDAASEKALFQRFAPKVLAIARRYATDEPQALDYLQESFVQVFKKIKQFDPVKGVFEGWLYRLSVNVVLQIMRKNRHSPLWVELPADLPAVEIHDFELEMLREEQVLLAVRELPEGYRQVLNLFVFENWSHREIAEALQISESTSRSQLARARQLLKQKLQLLLRHYEQGLV